ncbi:hypothetical protein WJX77_006080 [Trebouxia sp. C0004]
MSTWEESFWLPASFREGERVCGRRCRSPRPGWELAKNNTVIQELKGTIRNKGECRFFKLDIPAVPW